MIIDIKSLKIKDEYALGFEHSEIISGLEKLPALFAEIGEIKTPVLTDKRMTSLIFYMGIFSELKDGALHIDCKTLAKRYRMKVPSPGVTDIVFLREVGFKIDALRFIDKIAGKDGKIYELTEFAVSHKDIEILIAIKVFATACTLDGHDYFCALDFRLLSVTAPKPYKLPADEITPKIQMKDILSEDRFNIISETDKKFILAFDAAMFDRDWGLETNGHYKGYMWGRFMFIYYKLGVRAKQVAARFYVREDNIVLRLYFSGIDKHRAYIENAPPHIKDVFTGTHGDCEHCKDTEHKNSCKHRKIYTIEETVYEKCDGTVFEFWQPTIQKLPDYMALLDKFYASKKKTLPST
jgi:hypothetical protein